MRRPLLVGQAPGPNTDPLRPLYPASRSSTGGRLAQFMGLSPEEYLERFDRVNLLSEFPGKSGVEDKFPLYQARVAAGAIRPLVRDRVVVLIGRGVARAWGGEVATAEFLSWVTCPHFGTRLACVPHASGRNHWYNKSENREAVLLFWQTLLAAPPRTAEPAVMAANGELAA